MRLMPLFQKVLPDFLHARRAAAKPATLPEAPTGRRLKPGLCINGYLRSETGLGQAARNLAYACDAQRIPASFRHLPLENTENDPEFATKCQAQRDRLANMLVCGLAAVTDLQQEIAPGRLNILFPFWELPTVPEILRPVIDRFDQIWCASRFIETALRAHTDRPVHLLRQPVWTPQTCPPPRAHRSSLRILTFFDYTSFVSRKNPMGAVLAFQAAFAGRTDVELVIKSRGVDTAGTRKGFAALQAKDPRISVIDATLGRAEMDALIASCDAFLTLHRAEGFGFGGAEALARGKAVISTDFSGTTDFITTETGFPVAYRLRAVEAQEYVLPENASWAEPEIDSAVEMLRQVYDDPDEARRRTANGFRLLQDSYSFEATGAEIARLLSESGAL